MKQKNNLRVNSAGAAKGHILVQKRLMLEPRVPACGPELDEADVLEPFGAGRPEEAGEGDAVPDVLGQVFAGLGAGLADLGDLEVDAELGEALGEGVEETVWQRGGEEDEELVVFRDGHFAR